MSQNSNPFSGGSDINFSWKGMVAVAVVLILVLLGFRMVKTVPAGHVGVTTLFGKVQPKPYDAGIHVANPLLRWRLYDVRQKTHFEQSSVPTQDQLSTNVDVSIQYKLIPEKAPVILGETGNAEEVIEVHLVPKLRSYIREQGKSIERAEDFFLNETQERLQTALRIKMAEDLESKGIEIQDVLIRDITLPPFITKAIEAKKEREQAAERQKAELERFRTEQEQAIAAAQAQRKAAEEEAAKIRVLAEARAFEIEKINDAVGNNANYIKLQALQSLEAISKDPTAKIYFLNGDSPNPLPLMHLGDSPK